MAATLLASTTVRAQDREPLPALSAVALQVALDRHGFGVGLIDNRNGVRTQAALADFRKAKGVANAGDLLAKLEVDKVPTFRSYVITQDDIDQIGEAPADWLEASTVPIMACGSLLEVLSERFHVSEGYLRMLNPEIADWNSADAVGKSIQVPNTLLRESPVSAARLAVDCRQFRIRALDAAGQIIASFPCSIAAEGKSVPAGDLKVAVCARNPTYTFDPRNYPESPRAQEIGQRLIIQAGLNNPVGVFWIGLNRPGFGIHGSPHPETIGSRESHGCFRLTNWDVSRLGRMITEGTPVEVIGLGGAANGNPF